MLNELTIRIEHHTTISQYDLQIETLFWNLEESYRIKTQFHTTTKTIPRVFSTHKNPGGYAKQNKFSVNAGKT